MSAQLLPSAPDEVKCGHMVVATESRQAERLAVVFDGDDTLWSTEALYDRARDTTREVVSAAGLDGAAWEALERRIDVENVKTFGYSPLRFPTSCVQAYETLCRVQNQKVDDTILARIQVTASAVFECEPPVMPSAAATLSLLRSRGVRLALLTKGDLVIQQRRIESSGLSHFFDLTRIVSEKTAATINEVVDRLGAKARYTWMVGNSLRSDILPALEAGLQALWIDAHVWEHERSHDHVVDQRMVALTSLAEVPSQISPDAGQRRLSQR